MSFSPQSGDTPYRLYGAHRLICWANHGSVPGGAASGRCERPAGATHAQGVSAGENPRAFKPIGSKALETLRGVYPE
jgi:hypothetical protein